MKNVQVIDGAENCIFPIYGVEDADFELLFPSPGQNIEFVQDLVERMGSEAAAGRLVMRVTAMHLEKERVNGINGTLFIDMPGRRKHFPTKREADVFLP